MYYIDISTEQFESIRDHETTDLVIPLSLAREVTGNPESPCFQIGDELKLYHPSRNPEALRVEILGFSREKEGDSVVIRLKLNEWMMSLPEDRDQEEDELLFW